MKKSPLIAKILHDQQELEHYLHEHAKDQSKLDNKYEQTEDLHPIKNIHQLRGFLWAMASCPEDLDVEEWLPMVFGTDGETFALDPKHQTLEDTVMRMFNEACSEIFDEHFEFHQPYVYDKDTNKNKPLIDWCDGLLIGHAFVQDIWQEYCADEVTDEGEPLIEEVEYMLSIVAMFANPSAIANDMKSPEAFLAMLPQYFKEVLPVAILNYGMLGMSLGAQLTDESTETDSMVFYGQESFDESLLPVDSNEPCPCGSGKKYNKCCLH